MAIRTVGAAGTYPFSKAGMDAAIAACSPGDTVRILDSGTITVSSYIYVWPSITIEGDPALYDGVDKSTLPRFQASGSTRCFGIAASNVNIKNLRFEGFLITSAGNAGGAINGEGNTFGTLENLHFENCISCVQQGGGGTLRDVQAVNVGRLTRSVTGMTVRLFGVVQRAGYDYVFDNGSDTTGTYALGAVYQDGSRVNHSVANVIGTGPTFRNITAYRASGAGGTAFKGTYSYCTQTGYGALGSGTDAGNNETRDPLFTNAAAGDFTFQLASSEINSGTAISGVTTDMWGQTLPVGIGWPRGPIDLVTDVTPPTITGWTRTSKTTVVLTFSEDLDETSAETSGNYTTSPTRSVTAVLSPANVVTLTLSPEVDSLILTVAGVEDIAGNAMASWSRELSWATGSATDAAVIYAVADDGSSVGYLPGWDPMPSGVGSEATLERLVFVSFFSDARIADDQTPPDGTNDRRGWWADSDEDDNTGSTLWYLQGRAGVTAREYEDAAKAALAWMIADAVCTSVAVVATITGNRVTLVTDLTLVSGDVRRVAYPDLWSTINAA